MRCHSLRLDGVRACADDAVAAVYACLDPSHARAPVGAAGARLEACRIYGGNGGNEEEEGGFELHCGGGAGKGCRLAPGLFSGGDVGKSYLVGLSDW